MSNPEVAKAVGAHLLAILAVCTYAIAQPLFGLIGGDATFFVAHNASGTDVVMFALAVFVVPVVVVGSVVGATWAISPRVGRLAMTAVVALLGAVAVLQAVPSSWHANTIVFIVAALAVAFAIGALYHRAEQFRRFVQVIGLTAPVMLAAFVFASGASDIVFAPDVNAVGAGAATDNDVVVLVFDEFSLAALLDNELELDTVRYPNIARLAATSTWYDRTTTVSPRTQWAVPAILTGQRPQRDKIPIAAAHPQNLFTALAPTHAIDASEVVTRLCPTSICADAEAVPTASLYRDARIVYLHTALPPALADRWLPSITDRWAGFGEGPSDDAELDPAAATDEADVEFDWLASDLRTDGLDRWRRSLATLGTGERPTVSYHHALVPHAPYTFLADGRIYNGQLLDGLDTRADAWESDQAIVDTAIRRYAEQTQLVDAWIGQALDKLDAEGRFDDALIVVTSDHGTSLTAGLSRRSPTATTAADVAFVPLFVKYPGQSTAQRDSRSAQTIDILPTIADVMGVTLAEDVDGRSLQDDWATAERTILDLPADLDLESVLDLPTAVERLTRVVPPGAVGSSVFASLGGVDYGGRSTSSFDLGPALDASVVPRRSDLLTDVSLSRNFAPARFVARADGLEPGVDVLISLNGTVAAAATAGEWKGNVFVVALLDPAAMVVGSNRVEVFALDGAQLRPIEVADAPPYELDIDGSGRVAAVHFDGSTWDDGQPGYRGFMNTNADPTLLQGWSADVDALVLPNTLLLLDGDRVISTGFRRIDRNDVGDRHGESVRAAGYQIALSPDLAERIDEITVIALFDDGFLQFP